MSTGLVRLPLTGRAEKDFDPSKVTGTRVLFEEPAITGVKEGGVTWSVTLPLDEARQRLGMGVPFEPDWASLPSETITDAMVAGGDS